MKKGPQVGERISNLCLVAGRQGARAQNPHSFLESHNLNQVGGYVLFTLRVILSR
jgi:hypothetical protein